MPVLQAPEPQQSKPKLCIVHKDDKHFAIKHGLCMECYTAAKRAVESSQETWEGFIRMGIATDDSGDDKFMQALKGAKILGGK